MKRTIIIAVALLAFMQSCIVISVHPFYKEQNVVFKKQFEGEWKDNDNQTWRIHQNTLKPNSYELHCTKNGREVSLLAHLFTLNDEMYIDMVPINSQDEDIPVFDLHMVPTHSIAKVALLNDHQVDIKWFDEEWLDDMFRENRIKISHELIMDENPGAMTGKGMYLLTASTEELQKFVIKFGKNEKAYDSDLHLRLTK